MRKAFTIDPLDVEIDPTGDPDIAKIVDTITERTVMVLTDECIGEAVIVAGKIITSLFLVRNYRMVKIALSKNISAHAVVSRRDECNNIAELKPASLLQNDPQLRLPSGEAKINRGLIGGHGAPLLTSNTKSGKTVVVVASMRYKINVCERREVDAWKTRSKLPTGLVGGGIWNIDGEFVGLSLATKVSYSRIDSDMILALPAEEVLNFAETS